MLRTLNLHVATYYFVARAAGMHLAHHFGLKTCESRARAMGTHFVHSFDTKKLQLGSRSSGAHFAYDCCT